MTTPTGSYLKVAYDLRPAKQVERRMLIDTLQLLSANGFAIRDYQYTGMGSVYFFDFILFRKLLGIRRMLSVEYDTSIRKRVRYNRPFADVDVQMKRIGDVVPTLDRDLRHLLWLDYDFHLNGMVTSDAADAAATLSPGSILLVTVDVSPPIKDGGPADWKLFYEENVGRFFDYRWDVTQFRQESLPMTSAQIIFNAIDSGVTPRKNVQFVPIFSFLYADGHPMLTVGGMLASEVEQRKLRGCDFGHSGFLRFERSATPYEIHAPRLTRRERQLLDHNMPCSVGWKPKEFEITPESLAAYREIYRYLPAYAELLV